MPMVADGVLLLHDGFQGARRREGRRLSAPQKKQKIFGIVKGKGILPYNRARNSLIFSDLFGNLDLFAYLCTQKNR